MLEELINTNLKTVSLGRIEKDSLSFDLTTLTKISNLYKNPTAELIIEIEGNDNFKFLFSSHCLEDEFGNDYFKLKVDRILTENILKIKHRLEFEFSVIKKIDLYEQTLETKYWFQKTDYDKSNYLSDALDLEMQSGDHIFLMANTSYEEHEPRLEVKFIKKSEFQEYEKNYLKNWIFRQKENK